MPAKKSISTKETTRSTATASDSLDPIRHSLAHLLAAAVLEKFPDAKLGIGPVIDNGFYYDFELSRSLTPDDLKDFEKSMRKLVNKKLPFSGREVTVAEAEKLFAQQPFKLDLIKEFSADGKPLTVYKTGDIFFDLCRGGHVENTSEIPADAFELDKIAGAYWRGNEKNPQLQRIYGLAFGSKEELKTYRAMREEAKKRDHKILALRSIFLPFLISSAQGCLSGHRKALLSAIFSTHLLGTSERNAATNRLISRILQKKSFTKRADIGKNLKTIFSR